MDASVFMVEAGAIIYNLDVATQQAEKVGHIDTLINHVVKGGGYLLNQWNQ